MDAVIKIENLSKKFCKSQERSIAYGLRDVAKRVLGLRIRQGGSRNDESRNPGLRKDEFWALNGVSFELNRGETLGIAGPNGAGKTTLLKLLNGIIMPDAGRIEITGKTGSLIELGAGFHSLLSGRENIYVNGAILGMKKREIDKKFDSIVEFSGIGDFLDAPVKNYSSGMFVRLGFAIAIHCEPDILLIDEILAVGDDDFQMKCYNKLDDFKKQGRTILLVTRDLHHALGLVDRHITLKPPSNLSSVC